MPVSLKNEGCFFLFVLIFKQRMNILVRNQASGDPAKHPLGRGGGTQSSLNHAAVAETHSSVISLLKQSETESPTEILLMLPLPCTSVPSHFGIMHTPAHRRVEPARLPSMSYLENGQSPVPVVLPSTLSPLSPFSSFKNVNGCPNCLACPPWFLSKLDTHLVIPLCLC